MQKIINVLAVSSAVVSLALVGSVGYVYVNRTAIVEDIKEKAIESVLGDLGDLGGGLGGAAGGALGGGATEALPLGSNDLTPAPDSPTLAPTAPQASL